MTITIIYEVDAKGERARVISTRSAEPVLHLLYPDTGTIQFKPDVFRTGAQPKAQAS